jgi:eukaryotic-like serine/threonine-protein kinase
MSDSVYSSRISPGFEIAGRYVLIEEIGRGGTAAIFRAMDIASGQSLAVKHLTLSPDMSPADREMRIQRFRNEALTMRLLRHPHIMTVYDFKQIGSDYFMVVEFLQGLNLKEYVDRHAPSHREILLWIEQLLDALEYSHSKHIIHRDIKPENVMIITGKQVKLLDFGIAKIEGQNQLTIDGSMLGTVAYMSPEQIQNSRLITAQSDLYSLGVLMYELFTGKMPFNVTNPGTAVLEIFSRDAVPPMQLNPSVGPDLNQLILSCMNKFPQHRFANGRQLRKMIHIILDKAYRESFPTPSANSQAVLPRIRMFEEFRLMQAVKRLINAQVTGVCLIWNAWQQGSIGFNKGQINYVDIKNKHLGGDLLLMDLLAWESGNFSFIPGTPPEGSGQHLDLDQHVLMEEAQTYLQEIETLWPDYRDQDIPELMREPAKGEAFSKLAQAVFGWVDGQHCIGQLFALMPQDRLSILWGIRELEDRKYVFVERQRKE